MSVTRTLIWVLQMHYEAVGGCCACKGTSTSHPMTCNRAILLLMDEEREFTSPIGEPKSVALLCSTSKNGGPGSWII